MFDEKINLSRRGFVKTVGGVAGAAAAHGLALASAADGRQAESNGRRGNQRLSLERLQQYESLGYGMFISFDVAAFSDFNFLDILGKDLPDEKRQVPATVYAPDRLNVDQWISVARDAGMKYAVLTAKRYPGFCLWPSKHTDYTVANSGNKTDVVETFVEACAKRGVLPGLYYNPLDIHHRFGRSPKDDWKCTTSEYQTFLTAQITELLTSYGPIAEMWFDNPFVLNRGYRTCLYEHVSRLQPNAVIMMSSSGRGAEFERHLDRYWPSDLIAMEQRKPIKSKHRKWRMIEGSEYYMPGEVCDSMMPSWWWRKDEKPRPDQEVLAQFQACREAGMNFLLDAPPDNHGLIPQTTVDALMRLRRSAGI